MSGCLNCGPRPDVLPLSAKIAVGFGDAHCSKDGVVVAREDMRGDFHTQPTVAQMERKARRAPNHDWRIRLEGPLGGAVYQRQGKGQWVRIETLEGFA